MPINHETAALAKGCELYTNNLTCCSLVGAKDAGGMGGWGGGKSACRRDDAETLDKHN